MPNENDLEKFSWRDGMPRFSSIIPYFHNFKYEF
jgi:hypothetical protein